MNLQTMLRGAFPVLLAVGAAFWFQAISKQLLPLPALNWGLIVEQTSGEGGEARLYWETATADGLSQERSIGLPIEAGKREHLFFPLPRDAQITGLRFDPVDRAQTTPEIAIHRLELAGPMGFWFADKPGVKQAKAGADLEFEAASDPKNQQLLARVTGPDPQIRISVNPKPLPAPVAEFARASNRVALLAFLAFAALFLLIRAVEPARHFLLWLAGLGWVVFLLGHFVLPVETIDPFWFYDALFAPSLFLCLLAWPDSWKHVKPLLRHPPMWALAAFAGYFGILALGLSGDSEPTRGTVLLDLGFLLLAPAIFLVLREHFRFDGEWTRLVWIVIAAGTATVILFWMYGGQTSFGQRLFQVVAISRGHEADIFTPLHRAISGTAVFAMTLLLALSWADCRELRRARPRPSPGWLLGYFFIGAPTIFYTLFSQSRSPILGLLAGLIVLSLAPRAWNARLAAAVLLIFGLLFAFGDFSGFLDRITGRDVLNTLPAPAPAAVVVQAEDEATTEVEATLEPTEGGIYHRSTSGRPTIWGVYLDEILKKPIFGHGFGAKQKLLIELDESLFAPQDSHLAHTEWNPHSVHLSVLYFGGVVGFAIHTALLGSIFFFGFKRYRETRDGAYLLSSAWILFAAIAVAFESTLIAYDKDSVLLRYPNEYWIFYWGAIVFGVIQTVWKSEIRNPNLKTEN